MKKCISILTALLMLLSLLPVMAAGEDVRVFVENKEVSFSDQTPIIESGRTLVPLRAIFESMGVKVEWIDSTRTVVATSGNTVIRQVIGQSTMLVNNQSVPLEVPAKIVGDRTLIPLRAVSEALGATVTWNDSARTIHISLAQSDSTPSPTPTATPTAKPSNGGSGNSGGTTVTPAPSGQSVLPLSPETNLNASDFSTLADFSVSDLTRESGLYYLTVRAYEAESFDAYALAELSAGDTVVVSGETVTVQSVTPTEDGFWINRGGADEILFEGSEPGICSVTSFRNTDGSYQLLGTKKLPVSVLISLYDVRDGADYSENDLSGSEVYPYLEALPEAEKSFSHTNTRIRVKNGEIFMIDRYIAE